jgi:hypothetical protein
MRLWCLGLLVLACKDTDHAPGPGAPAPIVRPPDESRRLMFDRLDTIDQRALFDAFRIPNPEGTRMALDSGSPGPNDTIACVHIDAAGRVTASKIVQPSGHDEFDKVIEHELQRARTRSADHPLDAPPVLLERVSTQWLCMQWRVEPPNVPSTLLEAQRLAGVTTILPDEATRRAIVATRREKITGSFKYCLDTSGAVTTISGLKSTGFPDYDTAIESGIRAWKFRPFEVNGKASPVCTASTFVYSPL